MDETLIHRTLDILEQSVRDVGEIAIPLCRMEAQTQGHNVFLGLAPLPDSIDKPVIVTVRHVMPTAESIYFPKRLLPWSPARDVNYQRILEKGPRLAYQFLRSGDISAFDSRVETRGEPEGDWEGAFVIDIDGFVFIVILSGLTGKLSEAVLLTASVDAGLLTEEQAHKYSRPMKPFMLNRPRRNFDYFYGPVRQKWRELCEARDNAIVEEFERREEVAAV